MKTFLGGVYPRIHMFSFNYFFLPFSANQQDNFSSKKALKKTRKSPKKAQKKLVISREKERQIRINFVQYVLRKEVMPLKAVEFKYKRLTIIIYVGALTVLTAAVIIWALLK